MESVLNGRSDGATVLAVRNEREQRGGMSQRRRTAVPRPSVPDGSVDAEPSIRAGQVAADGRIRLTAGLALFALAGITAVVSYLHAAWWSRASRRGRRPCQAGGGAAGSARATSAACLSQGRSFNAVTWAGVTARKWRPAAISFPGPKGCRRVNHLATQLDILDAGGDCVQPPVAKEVSMTRRGRRPLATTQHLRSAHPPAVPRRRLSQIGGAAVRELSFTHTGEQK